MKFLLNLQKKKGKREKQNVEELKQEVDMDEHKVSIEELCARLKTNVDKGLTQTQAKEVLERDGLNQLTPPPTVSLKSIN